MMSVQKGNKKRKKIRQKSKDGPEKVQPTPIPVRKSLLDVLLTNFKSLNRVAPIHRIIYLGEVWSNTPSTIEFFKIDIDYVNSLYCEEKITGILLCYEKYFFHIIEGSQSVLIRHLRSVRKKRHQDSNWFRRMKLLIIINHIYQRFTECWKYYVGTPSQLTEQLESDSNIETSMRYLRGCIEKLYGFAKAFVKNTPEIEEKKTETTPLRGTIIDKNKIFDLSTMSQRVVGVDEKEELMNATSTRTLSVKPPDPFKTGSKRTSGELHLTRTSTLHDRRMSERQDLLAALQHRKSSAKGERLSLLSDRSEGMMQYREFLPELQLIDFLLACRFVETVAVYLDNYAAVPQIQAWFGNLWPVPSELVPYNVFDDSYNFTAEIEEIAEQKHEEAVIESDEEVDQPKDEHENINDAQSIITERIISVPTFIREEAGSYSIASTIEEAI